MARIGSISSTVGRGAPARPVVVTVNWEFKGPTDATTARYRTWYITPHSRWSWPRSYVEDIVSHAVQIERERQGVNWVAMGQVKRRKLISEVVAAAIRSMRNDKVAGHFKRLVASLQSINVADAVIHSAVTDSSHRFRLTIKVRLRPVP